MSDSRAVHHAGYPRSVLVLGGGSDLGLAITRALVARGARTVILAARHPDTLGEQVASLRAAGANVETIPFDAELVDTHESVVATPFEQARLGGEDIDLAIIAFGLIDQRSVLDESPAEAGHVAIVNYAGRVERPCRRAANARAGTRHRRRVVLRSRATRSPEHGALRRREGGPRRVQRRARRGTPRDRGVITVRPGWVHTKMTADRRGLWLATTPERVAIDVLRGLDRGARVVWSPTVIRYVAMVARWTPRTLRGSASRLASRWR